MVQESDWETYIMALTNRLSTILRCFKTGKWKHAQRIFALCFLLHVKLKRLVGHHRGTLERSEQLVNRATALNRKRSKTNIKYKSGLGRSKNQLGKNSVKALRSWRENPRVPGGSALPGVYDTYRLTAGNWPLKWLPLMESTLWKCKDERYLLDWW